MELILSILPTVQALPSFVQDLEGRDNLAIPFFFGEWIEDPQNPGNFYFSYSDYHFNSSRNLYFRLGASRTFEEKENDWWPSPPWEYRLQINGEEIDLKKYGIKADKEVQDCPFILYWYHIFGPNYFTPGEEYLIKFEFWVKNPYQGDGLNEWRIFVDYWGIYFPAGYAFSFEYYLNIVNIV